MRGRRYAVIASESSRSWLGQPPARAETSAALLLLDWAVRQAEENRVPVGREVGTARANRTRRLGVEPVAVAKAGFHGSAGFYFRIGVLGLVAAALFGVLALRLWSLQVIQGPKYAQATSRQAFRTVELPAARQRRRGRGRR
jgi:hypothetical protein